MSDDSAENREDSTSDTKSDGESLGKYEAFNYDEILEHIGQLGKFQWHTFLWLCLPAFFPGIIVMSYTFTGGIPAYR